MRKAICVLLTALLLLTGCSQNNTKTIFAMDTYVHINISGTDADKVTSEIETCITKFEGLFSVTDSNSEISRLNRDKSAKVSADTLDIIKRAVGLSKITDGAFDITVYPVVSLWGFTTDIKKVPNDTKLQHALKNVGYNGIDIDGDKVTVTGEIDLGGIAKGYTAERIRKILEENRINSAIVSIGGNALVYGNKTFTVGIQHPEKSDGLIATMRTENKSVVTSGGYQRYFEEDGNIYHHIIDPKSGYPADSGIVSATVITEDDAAADALATALYVMGVEKATELWKAQGGFDMVLVTNDTVYTTTDINVTDTNYKINIIE